MNNIIDVNTNKEMFISSKEVSKMIGKRHADLLKDIRGYIKNLNEGKIPFVDFFKEDSYLDSKNEKRPCYKVSKKGCEFIAHKLTGKKGSIFTAEYIEKFHQMKNHIKEIKPMNSMQILELQYNVLKEHEEKIDAVVNQVSELKNEMPLFAVDCKEIQALVRKIGISVLGGYKSTAYNNKSIRGKVYSDIHSQLKREFGVNRYEAIKRSEISKAKEILKGYKAPLYIKEMVKALNNQINIS